MVEKYQPMSVGGKYMKRRRKKVENVKGKKGEEKEKMGIKRIK
jgi:hypothetical protein